MRTLHSMRLLFTGGHHNSALEVAEYMKQTHGADILWLGHRHVSLSDKSDSAEYKEVTRAGIAFVDIKAGKVYKTLHPIHWLRLPYGFFQSLLQVARFRPDVIVSFGGYLAVPVVLAGWLMRVPSVTHEQTVVVGVANKFISRLAKKVLVTWEASKAFFPSAKVVVTGLPLRKAIFQTTSQEYTFPEDLPVVFITAGKQGSHKINMAVLGILPDLLTTYNVIHQCGSHTQYQDLTMLQQAAAELPDDLQRRYIVREYIFQDTIGEAFAQADIVVSRAGAHTIYELAALGKPAVIIPIPWVSHNEQYKNAEMLADKGAALILPEEQLAEPRALLTAINTVHDDYQGYQTNAKNTSNLIQRDAVERIAAEINSLAK